MGPLFRFQRDVTAAALTINTHQNFIVRLQLFAKRNQIFRAFDGLLVHFLNHVAFAQTCFRSWRLRIDVGNHGTLNLLWKIKRSANVRGDVRHPNATEHSCFFRLRGFFRRRLGVLVSSAGRHLGKLDLNYVWLHLGTIGRKTGWNEYWEARRSLDAVLKRNPGHVRARTARAWMEYIVATKTSIATRWLLGGGNRKRALTWVREAASVPNADFYVHTEAEFALWEMLVREKNIPDAVVVARRLAKDFPENKELIAFLKTNG